ncbi:MAG: sulfotransferase domain-containing protein, partial [Bauldia sp.]
ADDHGFPMINLGVSAGAIYVIRNPLDVVISFSHFRGVPIDQAIIDMATAGFGLPTDHCLVSFAMDSWSAHVRSWTERPSPAVHVVRYEDMLAEPNPAFGAIAHHVLMAPTPEQLSRAIAVVSFDRLKKAETDGGFHDTPAAAEPFFREGRAGQWRQVLSAKQVERIAADHGDQMGRFGYLPD